jgi:hypothetical protein
MKIGIVVSPLNNFKGFCELVESVKSQHKIIWYIQPQHRHQVPLAESWNKGLRDAIADGCEYIAILNDDILLSPKTLDNMTECFTDEVVLVSANNILGHLDNPYDIFTYNEQSKDLSTSSEHPNFSCFMITKDYIDKIGTFDENFIPAWFEDNDSHRRIKLLNYKAICTTYASCIHFGGVTTARMDNPSSSQSREYYIRKWGGLPESHPVPDDLKEKFTHPYNDNNLTPKDWEIK